MFFLPWPQAFIGLKLRLVGMLKTQKYLPSNEIFVIVAAAFAGITTAPWVELTRDEFLDMFGPDTVLQ